MPPMSYLMVRAPHLSLRQTMEETRGTDIWTVRASIGAIAGYGPSWTGKYLKRSVFRLLPGLETKTLTAGSWKQDVSLISKSEPERPESLPRTSVTQGAPPNSPNPSRTNKTTNSQTGPVTTAPMTSQGAAWSKKEDNFDMTAMERSLASGRRLGPPVQKECVAAARAGALDLAGRRIVVQHELQEAITVPSDKAPFAAG